MPLHIDFESRSTVDLKAEGLDRYSRHETTGLWCMAYAFGDDPVQLWTPNDPDPEDLLNFVRDGGIVKAHNATFEFIMWNRICRAWGWPTLNAEQMRCTMAMAYAMGLPGSLEKACAAVGLEVQKDMKGHRRMLQMARPRDIKPDGTIVWWDDDQRKAELYDYCKTDVEAERALDHRLRELPADEEAVRQLDTRINLRGVRVDLTAAGAIHKAVEREKERLDAKMERATGGMVKQCTWVNVLTDWVRFQGVDTPGIAKADVKTLLEDDEVPEHVKHALRIRQRAAKTSTAKIDKMFNIVSPDERVRWLFQYHGAATGRWAGRGIQLQNLPRGFLKPHEVEDALELFNEGDVDALEMLYGDPMDVASSCIRGLFIPAEGHVFQAADFSNIEGRVLAWLAGENWLLESFAAADEGTGPEVYKITAGGILGKAPEAITGWERQVFGKVPMLALGYGSGVGGFDSMARIYGINIGDHYGVVRNTVPEWVLDKALDAWNARGRKSGAAKAAWVAAEAIKIAWRDRQPAIVQFWYDLEDAALSAVANPGKSFSAGPKRIVFKTSGSFLWCRLPSGRLICYPYPKIEEKETPWGAMKAALTHMTVTENYKWARVNSYGGKLAENCLAEGTLVLCDSGWKPIERVRRTDCVWDGETWVSHGGLTDPIEKFTLKADGIWMTPDHEILTENGWKPALARPRPYRPKIRNADRARGFAQRWEKVVLAFSVRVWGHMREVWIRGHQRREERANSELRMQHLSASIGKNADPRHVPASGFCCVAQHDRPLQVAYAPGVEKLRGARHSSLQALAAVRELLGGHGAHVPAGIDAGSYRQRRELHAEKLPLGFVSPEYEQSTQFQAHQHPVGSNYGGPSFSALRYWLLHAFISARTRLDRRRTVFAPRLPQRKAIVYDLKNAGPRHRFTVMGRGGPLLVHNCTQALAADNLRFAMQNAENDGRPIVLHVHDEIVTEVPEGGDKTLEGLESLMERLPKWAEGLPLQAKGWEAKRFRKD